MKPAILIALAFAAFLAVACGSNRTTTPSQLLQFTPETPATSTPALTVASPTATSVPAVTPTPFAMDAQAVFEKIAPSIAFVETEAGTGSGVLVEGKYVVTNAHVVYPFNTVRVVFPDGSEFAETAVKNVDLLGDLAVLGPVDTDLPIVPLSQSEDVIVGRDAYLIGYPGEVEKFPKPTLSRGLISRKREWPAIGMTYLQSDAAIAGGQSGGVLVSNQSAVVGLSGNAFADSKFALAASAADIKQRVDQLIAGADVDGLGLRPMVNTAKADKEIFLSVDNPYAGRVYIVQEPHGTEVNLELSSSADYGLIVWTPGGDVVDYADEQVSGKERLEFRTKVDGPYFVEVIENDDLLASATISSSVDLLPVTDLDDNRSTWAGKTITGNIDFPGDIDVYVMRLNEGEEVFMRVESVMIDPFISVDMVATDVDDKKLPSDDDSGKGVFGVDAEMTYRAPQKWEYYLLVQSADRATGGYLLTLSEPDDNAPTPMAPEPTPTPFVTQLGKMLEYESNTKPSFSIQYPANWTKHDLFHSTDTFCHQASLCRFSTDGAQMMIVAIQQLDELSARSLTLDEYTELADETLTKVNPGVEFIGTEKITTDQGYEVTVVEVTANVQGVEAHSWRMLCLQDGVALNVTVVASGAAEGDNEAAQKEGQENIERAEKLADYVFGSLQISDD